MWNAAENKTFNVAEWKAHLKLLAKAEESFLIIKQEYYRIGEESKQEEREQQLSQLDEDMQKLEISIKFSINKYYKDWNKNVNNFESYSFINYQDHAKGVSIKQLKISTFSGKFEEWFTF